MNFQKWLNDADMPEIVNGQWIDLETGIPFADYAPQRARTALSAKSQDARAIAKAFGGKALKGSAKQKEWAEKIRAEKIQAMDVEQAAMACDPNGLLSQAKFWIENRTESGEAIGLFVQRQKALLKTARALKEKGAAADYARVAAEYNTLTAQWGWE